MPLDWSIVEKDFVENALSISADPFVEKLDPRSISALELLTGSLPHHLAYVLAPYGRGEMWSGLLSGRYAQKGTLRVLGAYQTDLFRRFYTPADPARRYSMLRILSRDEAEFSFAVVRAELARRALIQSEDSFQFRYTERGEAALRVPGPLYLVD